MPTVPLPKGISGLQSQPKQQEWLVNLFPLDNGAIRAPGVELIATGSGECRGSSEWRDGYTYMVSGTSLVRVNSDDTVTTIGTIAGTADCVFSQGQTNLVIIVKGGAGYYYNTTDGLVQITDTDFVPSVSVDFIDGRHVFIPYDGDPAFYSEIDAPGSISPLSFFDAEELPDKNRIVINVQNQIAIGGADSFEFFKTNIDPDVVFTRREGGRVDVGYIGGLTRFASTFAFIGRKRGQAAKIYAMGSGDAQGFSTPAIDEILAGYTDAQKQAAEGYRFEWKGLEILVFTLENHTFAFANGEWVFLDSTLDGLVTGPWRVKGVSYSNNKYIVGDRTSSNIGTLSDVATEYGYDVEFEVKTFIRGERDSNFDITSIEIDCLTGQKLTTETIGISFSRDGRSWSDFSYESLGIIGEYEIRVLWQPVGRFENFCGIRIRSTADVKFSLESIQYT